MVAVPVELQDVRLISTSHKTANTLADGKKYYAVVQSIPALWGGPL